MAWVSAPQKLLYQMPSMAITTGRFFSRGVSLKWLSMAWAPASRARKLYIPMESAPGDPIADQSDYRPPTQSHMGNTLSGSMPNFCAAFTLAVTAIKWLATACSLPLHSINHFRATLLFSSVSLVPKDFD